MNDPIVIAGAARTPIGAFGGALSPVSAPELGAYAIRAALERSGMPFNEADETIMGCVLSAGLGQAPARQAAIAAGIPDSIPAATVNKMCGSGLKALMLAHDAIVAGSASVVVAGGLESMSNAPYLLPAARTGLRMGHRELKDHIFLDGLEDAYGGELMGVYAEATAEKYGFSRADQDAFAIESLSRAKNTIEQGFFTPETVPVTVKVRKGETIVDTDETPMTADLDKIPRLKPAFAADGTVTAANSSSISDGAAALVLMAASEAKRRGNKPLARILGHASFAHEPKWFTTAPQRAIEILLGKSGWDKDEVDLYEINEAFAVVTMAAMRDLDIPHDKVNIHGGACALGHPIGASGARIMVTLLYALERRRLRKGIAAICIGGGEAVAMAVERLY